MNIQFLNNIVCVIVHFIINNIMSDNKSQENKVKILEDENKALYEQNRQMQAAFIAMSEKVASHDYYEEIFNKSRLDVIDGATNPQLVIRDGHSEYKFDLLGVIDDGYKTSQAINIYYWLIIKFDEHVTDIWDNIPHFRGDFPDVKIISINVYQFYRDWSRLFGTKIENYDDYDLCINPEKCVYRYHPRFFEDGIGSDAFCKHDIEFTHKYFDSISRINHKDILNFYNLITQDKYLDIFVDRKNMHKKIFNKTIIDL